MSVLAETLRNIRKQAIMASWPAFLGFVVLLTCNSAIAIHRSGGHAATIFFVGATYATLVLLLYCLHRFETAPPGSAARDRARTGVWLTTTLLTAIFSWRVSTLMPPPLAAAVWLAGCSTVIGGFYALFLLPTPATTDD
jgi:uncharacterized membrane protein